MVAALILMVLLLPSGLATAVAAAAAATTDTSPLWSRGSHYAKLSFAADLSSVFSFGNVTMHSPALGNLTTRQSSGMDVNLGAYDELTMGPFSVRYFVRLDAFAFARTYPAAAAFASAATAGGGLSGGLQAAAPCEDISGTYQAPAESSGTGPGGVNVVRTISQTDCSFTVGGESLYNGANGTVLAGGIVNGTDGLLKNKQGTFNGTHIQFGRNVWTRLSPGFPSFEVTDPSVAAELRCVGWEDVAFAPATRAPSLATCQNDGPILAFHSDGGTSHATFIFSAMDHFTTNVPAPSAAGISVATQGAPIPADTTMSTLLLARPGINRAMRAWGSVMRQHYNTTRNRGPATTGLSYWNDNQAGYSFWTVDHELDIWGTPEDIFVDLLAAYARKGIRFRSWETDQNFLGTMCPGCGMTKDGHQENGFGWCWNDVSKWNTTLFPSTTGLSEKLGGLPMVFYISSMCKDNVYRLSSEGGSGGKYRFIDTPGWTGDVVNAVVHPDDAFAAYTDMLAPLKQEANMQMLFTDFLCWRGPELQRGLPSYFEADHKMLEGMTLAAQQQGMEVQFCMACGHQALDSLRWPAVTNMRANGDGGLDVPTLAYSSLLQGALGLGFSKDNLRLSNCSVPPCHGAYDPYGAALQTLLAALSLGPVGLADQLFGLPHEGVDVNTNVTLAKSVASAAGFLLQPSFPLTPIDPCVAGEEGLSPNTGNIWATYTAVSGKVWFTVVGWGWDDQKPISGQSYTVVPGHLAPMIDNSMVVSGDFSAVPRTGFVGSGAQLDGELVTWDSGTAMATPFAAGVQVRMENHIPHQVNIAPVLGGVALLGEKGKAATISTYRFASIVVSSDDSLALTLRGEANESIELLFATKTSGFKVQSKTVVVGADGTVAVSLPDNSALLNTKELLV